MLEWFDVMYYILCQQEKNHDSVHLGKHEKFSRQIKCLKCSFSHINKSAC